MYYFSTFMMATAERIKSTRGKDRIAIHGYIYTLNKSTTQVKHWVCEKRGTCKARVTINFDLFIVKPDTTEILDSHSQGLDTPRIKMLQGYNKLKERAGQDPDQSTRSIYAYGVESMDDSSIVKLPKPDSIKRTIRLHKNDAEGLVNPASASEIEIPERFRITTKGEPFILFDSGFGDTDRIIIFDTPKMLSILRDSKSWFADGTFKVVPQQFYQLYTIHAEKDGRIFPCVCIHWLLRRLKSHTGEYYGI